MSRSACRLDLQRLDPLSLRLACHAAGMMAKALCQRGRVMDGARRFQSLCLARHLLGR